VMACLPFLYLLGCGGQSSHTVAVGTTGSLQGVDFVPADHTLNTDTGVRCRIYWHTGYNPPAEFVASLKKVKLDTSKKESVKTELKQVGAGYVWELDPVGSLDPESVYFVEVEAAPESEVAMFVTVPATKSRSVSEAPGTADAEDRGAYEHLIKPVVADSAH